MYCFQPNVFTIVSSHSKDFGMLCWLIIIKEKLKPKSFLRPENLTISFDTSFQKLARIINQTFMFSLHVQGGTMLYCM